MDALILLSLFAAAGQPAGAAPAVVKSTAPAPAAVEESTAPAGARTVEDIYWGSRFRSPFVEAVLGGAVGGGGGAKQEYKEEDFSIHELDLKGIMRDNTGAFAILADPRSSMGFVLRKGLLYDNKNKRVPGVSGRINTVQKSVVLITADKDVQTLRLGEDEEEQEQAGEKEEKAP